MRVLVYILFVYVAMAACRPSRPPVLDLVAGDTLRVKQEVSSEVVSRMIDSLLQTPDFVADIPNEHIAGQVVSVYNSNLNKAIWTSKEDAKKGVYLINSSAFHGLFPSDYSKHYIDSLYRLCWQSEANSQNLAILDVYLTFGVVGLIEDLYVGKLQVGGYHPSYIPRCIEAIGWEEKTFKIIEQVKSEDVISFFNLHGPAYEAMYKEFIRLWFHRSYNYDYRSLEYPGLIFQHGDTSLFVRDLKLGLIDRGFLDNSAKGNVFDDSLKRAVEEFQMVHGLNPDGVPGPKTYFFLKWTIDDYMNLLRVNMERQRWINNSFPGTRIEVNIPSADIMLYQDNNILFNSKVIVGKYDNQTPTLTSRVDYLVFNPCWTVPMSIATKKFLKRMQNDTTFLDKRNMFIMQNGQEVDHDTIDFKKYSEQNFPFKIYQRTSKDNALGKVKFMFPNPYSIYLHDTPGKSLFAKDRRTYSHGCVRVQKAEHFAEIILRNLDQNMNPIDHYYEKGYPVKVNLRNEIPLFINYFTCRYNEQLKRLQYFEDIYHYDKKLLADLRREKQRGSP